MNPGNQYDLIIIGAGCAGLSLAYHLNQHPVGRNSKILLIDKEKKTRNDRTWCFWEKNNGPFENIIHRKWDKLWFHGESWSQLLNIRPYSYKMIRSADYYQFIWKSLELNPNIHFLQDSVLQVIDQEKSGSILAESGGYSAPWIFDSRPKTLEKKQGHFYFLQHFLGWFIEMESPVFKTDEPILMDFRLPQKELCRFMYILPETPHRALVEYTLFSPEVLPRDQYKNEIIAYLNIYYPGVQYQIQEEEFGIIPMYSEPVYFKKESRIIAIGTAGGASKASTGYTYTRIQQHSKWIIQQLFDSPKGRLSAYPQSPVFQWFDSVLLHVLHHKNDIGSIVFQELFSKNPPDRVLRFLDENSNLIENFQIMQSVPILKFIGPGLAELFKMVRS